MHMITEPMENMFHKKRFQLCLRAAPAPANLRVWRLASAHRLVYVYEYIHSIHSCQSFVCVQTTELCTMYTVHTKVQYNIDCREWHMRTRALPKARRCIGELASYLPAPISHSSHFLSSQVSTCALHDNASCCSGWRCCLYYCKIIANTIVMYSICPSILPHMALQQG